MTGMSKSQAQMIPDHTLKIDPAYFDAVADGVKTFETRRDDRGFQRGQTIRLREYDKTKSSWTDLKYTGREVWVRIEWILTGGQFGVEPGFVVMAITRIPEVTE